MMLLLLSYCGSESISPPPQWHLTTYSRPSVYVIRVSYFTGKTIETSWIVWIHHSKSPPLDQNYPVWSSSLYSETAKTIVNVDLTQKIEGVNCISYKFYADCNKRSSRLSEHYLCSHHEKKNGIAVFLSREYRKCETERQKLAFSKGGLQYYRHLRYRKHFVEG